MKSPSPLCLICAQKSMIYYMLLNYKAEMVQEMFDEINGWAII